MLSELMHIQNNDHILTDKLFSNIFFYLAVTPITIIMFYIRNQLLMCFVVVFTHITSQSKQEAEVTKGTTKFVSRRETDKTIAY